VEHESHHHHHPHGTGVRWLDISLGVAAAIVSLVSLWLGLHSAHSMEKLVAANSYPYLELQRSMKNMQQIAGTGDFHKRVEYALVNNGIGPARVEWVELSYQGKPMSNLTELMRACCGVSSEDAVVMNKRGSVAGSLIRAGDRLAMFTADEPPVPNPAFDALHRAMADIKQSACYCSVFDECYLRKYGSGKPEPVKQCTPPAKPFAPEFVSEEPAAPASAS
jgi:hypothetical protein